MNPGPAPKPAALHLVNGNPSKKSKAELASALKGQGGPEIFLPDPPDELSDEAKAEWVRLGPEMIRLGLISRIDRAAFAVCCEYWATWLQAQVELKKLGPAGMVDTTPSGYKQQSVWLQIRNSAATGLRQYLSEFGMTPSARTGFGNLSPQLGLPFDDAPTENPRAAANPAARHFD